MTTIPGAHGIAQLATTNQPSPLFNEGGCCTRFWRSFHFNKTHPTIPRNIQLVMITVPTHLNSTITTREYLGICTPAFSHAWINAAPCSTLTFLPSTVISISALRATEMENGRHVWMGIEVFVGRRAAVTALRRSISLPAMDLSP